MEAVKKSLDSNLEVLSVYYWCQGNAKIITYFQNLLGHKGGGTMVCIEDMNLDYSDQLNDAQKKQNEAITIEGIRETLFS